MIEFIIAECSVRIMCPCCRQVLEVPITLEHGGHDDRGELLDVVPGLARIVRGET